MMILPSKSRCFLIPPADEEVGDHGVRLSFRNQEFKIQQSSVLPTLGQQQAVCGLGLSDEEDS